MRVTYIIDKYRRIIEKLMKFLFLAILTLLSERTAYVVSRSHSYVRYSIFSFSISYQTDDNNRFCVNCVIFIMGLTKRDACNTVRRRAAINTY